MRKDDFESLKLQYITSAIQHGIASMNGDYRTANKEYQKIEKVCKKISSEPEKSKEFFSSLINHSDPSVRAWASSHALSQNILIDEAIKVLKQVESEGKGTISLGAKIALKQWEKDKKIGGKTW